MPYDRNKKIIVLKRLLNNNFTKSNADRIKIKNEPV